MLCSARAKCLECDTTRQGYTFPETRSLLENSQRLLVLVDNDMRHRWPSIIAHNEPEYNNSWSTSKIKHIIDNIFLYVIRLFTYYRLQNKYPLRYQRADNICVADIYDHRQRRIGEKSLTMLATWTGPSI